MNILLTVYMETLRDDAMFGNDDKEVLKNQAAYQSINDFREWMMQMAVMKGKTDGV